MKNIIGKIIITALFCTISCSFIEAAPATISSHLSKIETNLWGFDYSSNSETERISRIEQSVFGVVNGNLSVEKRIEKINKALGFESQEESNSSINELMSNSPEGENSGVSYPQIDRLELKLFSMVYEKENIYKRLERLEKKIFGSTQEGDLASRTEKLKGYLRVDSEPKESIYARGNSGGRYNPYANTQGGIDPYGSNSYESDVAIQISGLEQSLFGKTFSQDPIGLRLNRLERKIFQRDFSSDDDVMRMQRLQAAASAKKTAKYYDMNKAQKFASTGMQLGTLVLMILALIL